VQDTTHVVNDNPATMWVDLHFDELKAPQPKFLVDWEQGPAPVNDRRDYPEWTFNPAAEEREGTPELDAYPANPVIAWYNWTYRDPSQSIKPQNVGATNITPRALLVQQLGLQLAPITYPNQVTQAPADWDDGIQVLPDEYGSTIEQQRIALAQKFAGYNPAVIQ
jgi:hypothetical protein